MRDIGAEQDDLMRVKRLHNTLRYVRKEGFCHFRTPRCAEGGLEFVEFGSHLNPHSWQQRLRKQRLALHTDRLGMPSSQGCRNRRRIGSENPGSTSSPDSMSSRPSARLDTRTVHREHTLAWIEFPHYFGSKFRPERYFLVDSAPGIAVRAGLQNKVGDNRNIRVRQRFGEALLGNKSEVGRQNGIRVLREQKAGF